MKSITNYADYEASKRLSAMLLVEPTYADSVDHDEWLAVLKEWYFTGSGLATLVSDFGLTLPNIGSSSLVVDRRPRKGFVKATALDTGFQEVAALPVVGRIREVLAALSLNKSQLAQILRVSRPTIYEWFQGKEPSAANAERLHTLLRILARASVSGAAPLNLQFVRQPMALHGRSLIEMLAEEEIDENRVVESLERVRAASEKARQSRTTREDHLRELGFEEPTTEQRNQQLARNMAQRDWPRQ